MIPKSSIWIKFHGLLTYHNGSHSFVQDSGTGGLFFLEFYEIGNAAGMNCTYLIKNGSLNPFHDNAKIFQTTYHESQLVFHLQHNGNVAFLGITTLGKPGDGSES